MLIKEIDDIFKSEKIKYAEAVPYSLLKRNEFCKKKTDFTVRSVIVFLIPYFNGIENGNISLYARAKDYHLYCKELEDRIVPQIKDILGCDAALFADTSPIYETDAALLAGLGVIGKNGLLINEEYSSFVFIASVFTSADIEDVTDKSDYLVRNCINCGKCLNACPVGLDKNTCISSVTQKKGQLSEDEALLLKKYGTVWGCDICQLVCPYTKKMIKNSTVTEIDHFKNDVVNHLTLDLLEKISKKEFKERAFSWRGKEVLRRNIGICEKK